MKALNLNKINVRTRNWGPALVARDMFRTMSHSWIDFTDTEYLKEEVGDAIMQCMPGCEMKLFKCEIYVDFPGVP